MKTLEDLNEIQKEALSAVQKLNNEMHDKFEWNNPNLPIFSITIAGFYTFISLYIAEHEIKLFNSENNDRIYYEKSDKYESFYVYLKRKYRNYKESLDKIKI